MRAIITLSNGEGDSPPGGYGPKPLADEIADFAGKADPACRRPGSESCFDLVYRCCNSGGSNVFGLWTLGAVRDLHGHGLPLLQRLVTFSLDRTVMNENVFATFL